MHIRDFGVGESHILEFLEGNVETSILNELRDRCDRIRDTLGMNILNYVINNQSRYTALRKLLRAESPAFVEREVLKPDSIIGIIVSRSRDYLKDPSEINRSNLERAIVNAVDYQEDRDERLREGKHKKQKEG